MNPKIKKMFMSVRVIVLIIALLLAIVAINPTFDEGVSIRSVISNSTADNAGIQNPNTNVRPTQREYITRIDNTPIYSVSDFEEFMAQVQPFDTINIKTNLKVYSVSVPNSTDIGLRVYEKPNNNLKKGLDISGGTRVLLKPDVEDISNLSTTDFDIVRENIEKRLNVYGLTELNVRIIKDKPAILGGKPAYISVEIAGVNEEEISGLISNQGKFEATIANQTVFMGSEKDITYICKSAQCSGLDPYNPCGQLSDGSYVCRFSFSIALSQSAAKRFAEITKDIDLITEEAGKKILAEKINFYLDGTLSDSLTVDGGLKGKEAVNVQITGSGLGQTESEARQNALNNMKELQSVLSTGSLPFKLEIVNVNLISPNLGANFLNNTIFIGIIGVVVVAIMIFLRYRLISIVIPIMITLFSEIILLLGMTALIGATLDLAAIAGIIITIGTGTNDQIVMIDEILKNRHKKSSDSGGSFLANMKNAFFIIFSAYATIVVAMIPLLFAGAGLLKGFAITTILGATFGVFITRPAFAKMIEILLEK
jgi:preprotein translocase subunit SecD